LIGSLNLTAIAVRLLRIEGLRETGSKNPGVANLFRVAGAKVAALVLILEVAKAFPGLLAPRFLAMDRLLPYFALPFVIGDLFPIFHRFRGGKGVAATMGALLVLDYRVMLMGGVVFILMFFLFRRVSVSSLSMAASYPLLTYLICGKGYLLLVTICLCVILFITHRSNIKRIVEGNEPKLLCNR
jgi:glycerol-3-phosphate acyltransferase PlsY